MVTKTAMQHASAIGISRARLASYLRSDSTLENYCDCPAWTPNLVITFTGKSMLPRSGATYRARLDKRIIGRIRMWALDPNHPLDEFYLSLNGVRTPVAYLTDFWVHSERRRNGYGIMLLGVVERIAFTGGMQYTVLHAAQKENLTTFYSRRGYKIINNDYGYNCFQKKLEMHNR